MTNQQFMTLKLSIIAALICLLLYNPLIAQSKNILQATITGRGKQTIIFIPGYACSGDVWKETVTKFEETHTCITLTMPGIAGVAPQSTASMHDWEALITDYIKQNKIDKPVIVGHSLGGVLALSIAADYPSLALKIVVVDALPCYSAMQNTSFKAKENNDCAAMIGMMTGMSDERFYQMQLGMVPQLVSDTARVKQIAHWGVTSDRKTLGAMYCDFLNTDVREKIGAIRCPSLILLESSFANIKPAIEEQYKNMKTAQLVYSTKGLHFIMYDDVEWYNKQLAAFIK
jgi:pimeloyl-ACP methyl ester carboxylesterase